MNFQPIETLPNACPLFVEDAYKKLVNRLGVRTWHWGQPGKISELERFLLFGESRTRLSDFFEPWNNSSRFGYHVHYVFDHCLCFKSKYSLQFVLTMPYGDNETFYRNFELLANSYYQEKGRLAEAVKKGFGKNYKTPSWNSQFNCLPKMMATIVPNWFKVRENGDFAAIIAMDNQLRWLSEHGSFPLVNADGSER